MPELTIDLVDGTWVTGYVSAADEHALLFGELSGEKWIDFDGGTSRGGSRIRVASIVRVKLPLDRTDPVAVH